MEIAESLLATWSPPSGETRALTPQCAATLRLLGTRGRTRRPPGVGARCARSSAARLADERERARDRRRSAPDAREARPLPRGPGHDRPGAAVVPRPIDVSGSILDCRGRRCGTSSAMARVPRPLPDDCSTTSQHSADTRRRSPRRTCSSEWCCTCARAPRARRPRARRGAPADRARRLDRARQPLPQPRRERVAGDAGRATRSPTSAPAPSATQRAGDVLGAALADNNLAEILTLQFHLDAAESLLRPARRVTQAATIRTAYSNDQWAVADRRMAGGHERGAATADPCVGRVPRAACRRLHRRFAGAAGRDPCHRRRRRGGIGDRRRGGSALRDSATFRSCRRRLRACVVGHCCSWVESTRPVPSSSGRWATADEAVHVRGRARRDRLGTDRRRPARIDRGLAAARRARRAGAPAGIVTRQLLTRNCAS